MSARPSFDEHLQAQAPRQDDMVPAYKRLRKPADRATWHRYEVVGVSVERALAIPVERQA